MSDAANADLVERSEADRLQKGGIIAQLVKRPEIGAFVGMIVIIVLLGWASEWRVYNALGLKNNLSIIGQLGIIAVGACLLMIAGEFDLSIGSMIGFAGMSIAMMLKWGLPFGMGEATPVSAFFLTLMMTLTLGWIIGNIVVRSGLSSFIVTLGFLFFLRGATEVSFRIFNEGSTQISGLQDFKETSWFASIFGGETFTWAYDLAFQLGFNLNRKGEQWVTGLDARVAWWLLLTFLAYIVLSRTQLGNWIFATGDNSESARANGVPVNKVRIGLFMFTAFCATLFAACQVFDTNTADAAKGNLKELEAIAVAVVGGTLMTGGFGSVIGIMFGAVIFGLVQNAVFFIPSIDGSYFRVFVGTVLLVAAFANENIRKRITGGI
ncbi:ABC transporter permease [Ahrensia sp. R2A130]|uniref:ABC transporter permease n=1 Tax=Ahrensia sp. R2A130 TaxID=744979 RepID=UPI0001E0ACBE|nr:ABC transporter permease [Ahrensia sp. R2A130]EFL88685.1 inner-membrane translocator [Ahrensia sp. R2A130]